MIKTNNNRSALIADDDSIFLEVLTELLSNLGFSVTAVNNGDDAISSFTSAIKIRQPFNLVCLDIMMPKQSGLEALKAIRSIERESTIIESNETVIFIISSQDSPQNIDNAFFDGQCSTFLPKPIRRHILESNLRIQRLL